MKIGVLSDTHIHTLKDAQLLAAKLLAGPFAEVEAILHAGDVVIAGMEACFAPLPWYAVRGNMDSSLTDVPISRIVTLVGKRIGMVHGWGTGGDIEGRIQEHFRGLSVDVIVFGHSHQPLCRNIGPLLLFNPGSAADRRKAPEHTVGVITLEAEINAEIIAID